METLKNLILRILYQILKKKARNCALLLGVILLLGLLVGFLFYYFATRENKLTFIVLGTISLGIIFSFFHLMYSMRLDYLRKANQFIQILKDKGDAFIGIVNGVDYDEFSPERDTIVRIPYNIDNFYFNKIDIKMKLLQRLGLKDNGKPLYSFVSRLTWQKGIDHLLVAAEFLAQNNNNIVILGMGSSEDQGKLEALRKRYPHYISVHFIFNNEIAHYLYAASDFVLLPSTFEPCGLSQIYAMRYGAIPVVRLTGGLKDTVIPYTGDNIDIATGFGYSSSNPKDIIPILKDSYRFYFNLPKRKKLIRNAMSKDFSWNKSAQEYLDIYTQLINNY